MIRFNLHPRGHMMTDQDRNALDKAHAQAASDGRWLVAHDTGDGIALGWESDTDQGETLEPYLPADWWPFAESATVADLKTAGFKLV